MTSPLDLIEMLDDEAENFTEVFLVVRFASSSTFISTYQADRHEQLDEAVKKGGEPIGIIGALWDWTGAATFYVRTIAGEHETDATLKAYLESLFATFAEILEHKGKVKKGEWIYTNTNPALIRRTLTNLLFSASQTELELARKSKRKNKTTKKRPESMNGA